MCIHAGKPKNRPPKYHARQAANFNSLLGNGKTPAEVVELLGVSLSSAKRWKKVVERDGPAGLAAKPHPGPRPKLSEDQRDELCDLLVAGALAAGFATDLWTCFRVSD